MNDEQWILFDIGGVLELVDDDAWQEQWWQRWCIRSGLSRAEFDERIEGARLPAIDVTTGTEGDFWQTLANAIALDETTLAEMRADFWNAYCGTGNTALIAYARSLRGRARAAILSNSVDGAREEEERRFAFSEIFDPICYSHEQGMNKPDARAYLRALERLDAAPERVFFVDDHAVSIQGAAAVGIRGILHRDNAQTIAAIEHFLADTPSP